MKNKKIEGGCYQMNKFYNFKINLNSKLPQA